MRASWSWIWTLKFPPKIKLFLWKCAHPRIPTKSIIFNHLSQTLMHVFRDCPFVRSIWLSFPPTMLLPDFFTLDLHNWCKQNTKIYTHLSYISWKVLFAFTVWEICLGQNSLIFSGKMIPYQALKDNSISHATKFYFLSSFPVSSSSTLPSIWIRWCPGPFPFITINTDASSIGNPGPVGAGGLACSHIGAWLWGFSMNLGRSNNTVAELWGIRATLRKAWNKGHWQVLL